MSTSCTSPREDTDAETLGQDFQNATEKLKNTIEGRFQDGFDKIQGVLDELKEQWKVIKEGQKVNKESLKQNQEDLEELEKRTKEIDKSLKECDGKQKGMEIRLDDLEGNMKTAKDEVAMQKRTWTDLSMHSSRVERLGDRSNSH